MGCPDEKRGVDRVKSRDISDNQCCTEVVRMCNFHIVSPREETITSRCAQLRCEAQSPPPALKSYPPHPLCTLRAVDMQSHFTNDIKQQF
jgi:hypothetical protein